MNALSCIALCNEFGLDKTDIKNALLKYTGAERRFQYLFLQALIMVRAYVSAKRVNQV